MSLSILSLKIERFIAQTEADIKNLRSDLEFLQHQNKQLLADLIAQNKDQIFVN